MLNLPNSEFLKEAKYVQPRRIFNLRIYPSLRSCLFNKYMEAFAVLLLDAYMLWYPTPPPPQKKRNPSQTISVQRNSRTKERRNHTFARDSNEMWSRTRGLKTDVWRVFFPMNVSQSR